MQFKVWILKNNFENFFFRESDLDWKIVIWSKIIFLEKTRSWSYLWSDLWSQKKSDLEILWIIINRSGLYMIQYCSVLVLIFWGFHLLPIFISIFIMTIMTVLVIFLDTGIGNFLLFFNFGFELCDHYGKIIYSNTMVSCGTAIYILEPGPEK